MDTAQDKVILFRCLIIFAVFLYLGVFMVNKVAPPQTNQVAIKLQKLLMIAVGTAAIIIAFVRFY